MTRNRRDQEQRKNQNAAAPQQPQGAGPARLKEYFVPREGIDREVITADIRLYLGNETLVRPGNFEVSGKIFCELMLTVMQNPHTGKIQQGYYITEAPKRPTMVLYFSIVMASS